MKIAQEFTPKYWFVHSTETEDVYLWTGDKSMQGAIDKYNQNVIPSFEDEEDLEVILVGLEPVV
ncbi:hypothetical protein VP501E541_P0071 [Vibrio phage 501E54-1]|nr:hypothetical protein VP501E541_P0071 [Vibrio phage 501E54-1]